MSGKGSILLSLLSFGTNNSCFCCKSDKEPIFSCVNHCVFLCEACAELLKDDNIMHIKSIKSPELWSDKQIQSLSYGGNSRFDEFLEPYLIHIGQDKYHINVFKLAASEFYRKRIEAFTNLGYFSEAPPNVEEGSLTIEYETDLASDPIIVDETEENKENLEDHKNERLMKIHDEDRTGLDKIGDELKDLWEATGDIFSEHSKAAWESTADFRAKASNATKTAIDGAGEITKETWNKTKDISTSAWSKTGDFFSYLGQKTSETFGNSKESDENGSNTEKINNTSKISGLFSGWFGSKEENQNKEESKEENIENPEKQYFDFNKPKE